MNYPVIRDPVQDTIIYPAHTVALKDPNCKTRIYQLTEDGKNEPFAEVHLVRSESEGRPMLRMSGYTGEFKDLGDKKLALMTPLFTMLSPIRGYMTASPESVTLELADRFMVLCNLNFVNCELTNCTMDGMREFAFGMSQMVDVLTIHMQRELGGGV